MKKSIQLLKQFFSTTNQLIHSTDFLERRRLSDKAFLRKHKMPFDAIIMYLLSLPQISRASALDSFFYDFYPKVKIP